MLKEIWRVSNLLGLSIIKEKPEGWYKTTGSLALPEGLAYVCDSTETREALLLDIPWLLEKLEESYGMLLKYTRFYKKAESAFNLYHDNDSIATYDYIQQFYDRYLSICAEIYALLTDMDEEKSFKLISCNPESLDAVLGKEKAQSAKSIKIFFDEQQRISNEKAESISKIIRDICCEFDLNKFEEKRELIDNSCFDLEGQTIDLIPLLHQIYMISRDDRCNWIKEIEHEVKKAKQYVHDNIFFKDILSLKSIWRENTFWLFDPNTESNAPMRSRAVQCINNAIERCALTEKHQKELSQYLAYKP